MMRRGRAPGLALLNVLQCTMKRIRHLSLLIAQLLLRLLLISGIGLLMLPLLRPLVPLLLMPRGRRKAVRRCLISRKISAVASIAESLVLGIGEQTGDTLLMALG